MYQADSEALLFFQSRRDEIIIAVIQDYLINPEGMIYINIPWIFYAEEINNYELNIHIPA
jgi:hypothetical protein